MEAKRRRSSKRVSFAEFYQVKEFNTSDVGKQEVENQPPPLPVEEEKLRAADLMGRLCATAPAGRASTSQAPSMATSMVTSIFDASSRYYVPMPCVSSDSDPTQSSMNPTASAVGEMSMDISMEFNATESQEVDNPPSLSQTTVESDRAAELMQRLSGDVSEAKAQSKPRAPPDALASKNPDNPAKIPFCIGDISTMTLCGIGELSMDISMDITSDQRRFTESRMVLDTTEVTDEPDAVENYIPKCDDMKIGLNTTVNISMDDSMMSLDKTLNLKPQMATGYPPQNDVAGTKDASKRLLAESSKMILDDSVDMSLNISRIQEVHNATSIIENPACFLIKSSETSAIGFDAKPSDNNVKPTLTQSETSADGDVLKNVSDMKMTLCAADDEYEETTITLNLTEPEKRLATSKMIAEEIIEDFAIRRDDTVEDMIPIGQESSIQDPILPKTMPEDTVESIPQADELSARSTPSIPSNNDCRMVESKLVESDLPIEAGGLCTGNMEANHSKKQENEEQSVGNEITSAATKLVSSVGDSYEIDDGSNNERTYETKLEKRTESICVTEDKNSVHNAASSVTSIGDFSSSKEGDVINSAKKRIFTPFWHSAHSNSFIRKDSVSASILEATIELSPPIQRKRPIKEKTSERALSKRRDTYTLSEPPVQMDDSDSKITVARFVLEKLEDRKKQVASSERLAVKKLSELEQFRKNWSERRQKFTNLNKELESHRDHKENLLRELQELETLISDRNVAKNSAIGRRENSSLERVQKYVEDCLLSLRLEYIKRNIYSLSFARNGYLKCTFQYNPTTQCVSHCSFSTRKLDYVIRHDEDMLATKIIHILEETSYEKQPFADFIQNLVSCNTDLITFLDDLFGVYDLVHGCRFEGSRLSLMLNSSSNLLNFWIDFDIGNIFTGDFRDFKADIMGIRDCLGTLQIDETRKLIETTSPGCGFLTRSVQRLQSHYQELKMNDD